MLLPREVKALLKAKGWSQVALAAHWDLAITYVNALVNKPEVRTQLHEDAFRGLPERRSVQIVVDGRHKRKPPPKRWTGLEMYPVGRIFITLDSSLGPEEGTELEVIAVQPGPANRPQVTFRILTGVAEGDILELEHGPMMDSLSDTGQDSALRYGQG